MADIEKVLITGGGGFIGSHAAEYYATRGYEVTVFDNLSRGETLDDASQSRAICDFNWRYLREHYPEICFERGDVRNVDDVATVVDGQDAVIHTAGQVAVTSSLADPRTDFDVNARGTFNVLEAARQTSSDPTVVYASTNKVYGDNVNHIPVEERERRYWYADPDLAEGIPESLSIDDCEHTPYGVSKLAADLYVQDYAERGVLDAASFRMSCIYGTRQFGNEDQGWIAHFVRSAFHGDDLTIYGDGKQVRDALFVTDLVQAYDAFVQNPQEKSTVYNVGGGVSNTTSLLELLSLLEDDFGLEPSYVFDEWREGDQKVYVSDVSRVTSELEWKPTVDLSEGIARYLAWYEDVAPDLVH